MDLSKVNPYYLHNEFTISRYLGMPLQYLHYPAILVSIQVPGKKFFADPTGRNCKIWINNEYLSYVHPNTLFPVLNKLTNADIQEIEKGLKPSRLIKWFSERIGAYPFEKSPTGFLSVFDGKVCLSSQ